MEFRRVLFRTRAPRGAPPNGHEEAEASLGEPRPRHGDMNAEDEAQLGHQEAREGDWQRQADACAWPPPHPPAAEVQHRCVPSSGRGPARRQGRCGACEEAPREVIAANADSLPEGTDIDKE